MATGEPWPSSVERLERGRPIPDAANSIAELCLQIGEVIAGLTGGAAVGIKPIPQMFPKWEIEIRLLQFPK